MNKSVIEWLDCTVQKYGNKKAFFDEKNDITFSKFNEYTKSVGTYIHALLPQQTPVLVMCGRNVFTPACFLGIVRAGCFYAPVDGTMPHHRLNQIIGVIKSPLMVVDKENLETAKQLEFDGQIVVLEDIINTPSDEKCWWKQHKT